MDHEQAIQNLATERYLLSEMTPAERESFEEHYFECVTCAEDLRVAAEFLKDAKSLWLADEARAAHQQIVAEKQPSSRSWFAWLQPQFAAPAIAALALTAGVGFFQSVSLRTELGEVAAPRVVSTTTLKPTTRGDSTVLTATEGSAQVLQFDLDQVPASGLQFVVKSADDRVLLRFPVEQHPSGERVTLSIPRFDLSPGRYTLVVSSVSGAGAVENEVARYPLDVKRP